MRKVKKKLSILMVFLFAFTILPSFTNNIKAQEQQNTEQKTIEQKQKSKEQKEEIIVKNEKETKEQQYSEENLQENNLEKPAEDSKASVDDQENPNNQQDSAKDLEGQEVIENSDMPGEDLEEQEVIENSDVPGKDLEGQEVIEKSDIPGKDSIEQEVIENPDVKGKDSTKQEFIENSQIPGQTVELLEIQKAQERDLSENNEIKSDTMAVLVGDFVEAEGLGENWQPANIQTMMHEYSKGKYLFTIDFKTTKEYNYKVALNRQWDSPKALGDNGENKKINVTEKGKVTFLADAKEGKVYDSINDPTKFKIFATLTGTLGQIGGQDWTPGDEKYDLDYIGDGFYKKTFSLKEGTYEYKVAYDHDWDNGEVGNNVKFTLDEDKDVTFLANPILGICTDSNSNPSILGSVSLIGTIRNDKDKDNNWKEDLKGYEFLPLTNDGKLIYSGFFKEGNYEYKGIQNYTCDAENGGTIPAGISNVKIEIPQGGSYIVFVCDRKNKKIYDSINNPHDIGVFLGFEKAVTEVKSPVINSDGKVTFNYKNKEAKQVYLAGTMTDWQNQKKLMTLTDEKEGIWSITLNLGDAEYVGAYKFIVDGNWIADPCNNDKLDKDGNSILDKPEFKGRKVVIAGTIQSVAGEDSWAPGSDKTVMEYEGDGIYTYTFEDVPTGDYEYKVAMGSWDENYGAGGIRDGENIKVSVKKTQDITFTYSDDSHIIVDSINYNMLDIDLCGTGIPEDTKFEDPLFTGVYEAKIKLNKGTYDDIKAVVKDGVNKDRKYNYEKIEVKEDSKEITFSFDSVSEVLFTDVSDKIVDTNKIYFNSRDLEYKNPYGAVPTNTPVTFNLKTGKDITQAKLIMFTDDGIKKIDMTKSEESFDEDIYKWTTTYTFPNISMNKYYFVVSNGSNVIAYGDDDGYYGKGQTGKLGNVKYYGINVYNENFKTPDWMKNAVAYQIFPDRFFNGDCSNDYAQLLARGYAPYEFYNNWYDIPENPNLEYEKDKNGEILLDENGNPIIKEDYKKTGAATGDGYKNIWCNEMYGGDIKGIQQKLDYLKALGVNTLYINPIAASISNHRYDTTDYRVIDPLLGDINDFVNLENAAKERGMHIILDGVFNHVSDDSVYFDRYGKYMAKNKPIGAYQYWSMVYDLMNLEELTRKEAEKKVTQELASNGITDLHYKDWFKIDNKKVEAQNGDPEHYDYEGWWGYDSMPVIQSIDGSEYNVKSWSDEIIDGQDANSRYWLKKGSDGWRLDVANEVSDETWRKFRDAVKEEGDNVVIGEIWTDASKYLLGDMYDSVMNYRFRDAVINYIIGNDSSDITTNKLELIREQYPKEAFEAMLNLVDSHDTQRVISALDGIVKDSNDGVIAKPATDKAKQLIKLVPLMQMTYPGAPCIYYGDEIGMVGAKDPDDRRAMAWGKGDKNIVNWYAKMANIRNNYEVLRTGNILPIEANNEKDIIAYGRYNDNNSAVILVNRNSEDKTVTINIDSKLNIKDGIELTDVISNNKFTVEGKSIKVDIPAYSGLILVKDAEGFDVDEDVNYDELKQAYDSKYEVEEKVRVEGITLDKNEVDMKVNDTSKLNVVVTPEDATLKDVTYSTDNDNVVKVSKDGEVTAVGEGTANIEVRANDPGLTENNKGYYSVCKVTVKGTSSSDSSSHRHKHKDDDDDNDSKQNDKDKEEEKDKKEEQNNDDNKKELDNEEKTKIINMIKNKFPEKRYQGKDRYETSIKISKSGWKKSDYVVLVTGQDYVDALSSVSLAKKYNAPILLTRSDKLSSLTKQEIERLKCKNVLIVGGEKAVSNDIQNSLTSNKIKCTRIGGKDRYKTSELVANHIGNKKEAIIVSGNNFADAMSISSYAAFKNIPVLLVNESGVPDSTSKYLKDNNIKYTYVIGGNKVISDKVMNLLPNASRISGQDRYSTNFEILNKFKDDFDLTNVYIASGLNYADAISASALAAKTKSPILLTGKSTPESVLQYIEENKDKIKNIYHLGNTDWK